MLMLIKFLSLFVNARREFSVIYDVFPYWFWFCFAVNLLIYLILSTSRMFLLMMFGWFRHCHQHTWWRSQWREVLLFMSLQVGSVHAISKE